SLLGPRDQHVVHETHPRSAGRVVGARHRDHIGGGLVISTNHDHNMFTRLDDNVSLAVLAPPHQLLGLLLIGYLHGILRSVSVTTNETTTVRTPLDPALREVSGNDLDPLLLTVHHVFRTSEPDIPRL